MSNDYPHFVKKESDFRKEKYYFTGFYMPDEDYEKLLKVFPDGCEDSHISEYTIPFEGKILIDAFYERTEPQTDQRKFVFDEADRIKKENQFLLWDWSGLLHDGYWPMFDKNLNLVCGRGRTYPNKDTKIILLEKVPAKVQKLWNEIKNRVVIPMQQIPVLLEEKYAK